MSEYTSCPNVMFSALMTNTNTILRNVWFNKAVQIDKPYNTDLKCVYSDLLDEFLNFKSVTFVADDVSKIFIFELDYPMYTMSFAHNIGLRDFKDAYLVIEIFEKKKINEIGG